jgi:hypothetical protein
MTSIYIYLNELRKKDENQEQVTDDEAEQIKRGKTILRTCLLKSNVSVR